MRFILYNCLFSWHFTFTGYTSFLGARSILKNVFFSLTLLIASLLTRTLSWITQDRNAGHFAVGMGDEDMWEKASTGIIYQTVGLMLSTFLRTKGMDFGEVYVNWYTQIIVIPSWKIRSFILIVLCSPCLQYTAECDSVDYNHSFYCSQMVWLDWTISSSYSLSE